MKTLTFTHAEKGWNVSDGKSEKMKAFTFRIVFDVPFLVHKICYNISVRSKEKRKKV